MGAQVVGSGVPQMETLTVSPHDIHLVHAGSKRVLFHVATTSLFELDEDSEALLEDIAFGDGQMQFAERFRATRDALQRAGILRCALAGPQPAVLPSPGSLVSLVLNVNTGCNLACTYCYKEDLAVPARGRRMSIETALASVDLLLKESAGRKRVTIVFFGGEPLTNVPVIRAVVGYARRKAAECGTQVQFSLTTNATLLTEELADFFDAHEFGISVSIDGPKHIHDRHRLTVGRKGTYDLVSRRARMLIDRMKSRPVAARVTLTRGTDSIVEIFDHLKTEIGFHEVGIAPATAAEGDSFAMDGNGEASFFKQLRTLGARYVAAAIRGEYSGFSNMHHLMLDLANGNRKLVPCGAGVGLLAVDMEGKLNLCHRFTGSPLETFGSVRDGIDRPRLNDFLRAAQDRTGRGCGSCRIRNLCSGGCYHDNYTHTGDPLSPAYTHCDAMRDWIDYCIRSFVEIREGSPEFLRRTSG